jgi:hypothetical protein
MIRLSDKDITFISIGGKIINTVYKGAVIVWQNIVGWWINDRPWNNDNIWRNQ